MNNVMYWISIFNLLLTIALTGLAIFFTYWWSSYRKMLPWEIARKHYKEIVKKGLCPKCACGDVEIDLPIGPDGYPEGLGTWVCNGCGNRWGASYKETLSSFSK